MALPVLVATCCTAREAAMPGPLGSEQSPHLERTGTRADGRGAAGWLGAFPWPQVRVVAEDKLMGTTFRVEGWTTLERAPALAEAIREGFAKAVKLQEVASDYDVESELSRFNAGSEPMVVSRNLGELIEVALAVARESGGAFDPAAGTMTRLWRRARTRGVLPGAEDLRKARRDSGYANVTYDPATRQLGKARAGLRLDLGGIGKGAASETIFRHIRDAGYPCVMVATGGDIRLGAAPPGRPRGWRVGVSWRAAGQVDQVVELADCAISTSGNMFQKVEVGGKTYSHIIDPATGLGMTSARTGSVIASTATLADAWATALVVSPDGYPGKDLPSGVLGFALAQPEDSEEGGGAPGVRVMGMRGWPAGE